MKPITLNIRTRDPITIELAVGKGTSGEWYDGTYEVVPKREEQTLPTALKTMRRDVLVHEIPWWETSNPHGKTYVIGE